MEHPIVNGGTSDEQESDFLCLKNVVLKDCDDAAQKGELSKCYALLAL